MKLGIRGLLAIGLMALASVASAQAWPNRPVRVVIPFPPGGTLDTVGRLLAQKLGDGLGQNFIVENRPGGNGTIGADIVAKAPGDRFLVMISSAALASSFSRLAPPRSLGTEHSSWPAGFSWSKPRARLPRVSSLEGVPSTRAPSNSPSGSVTGS